MASAQDVRRHEQLLLLPEIRRRTSEILRHAYADALALIRLHHAVALHIMDILIRDGMISGRDVEALLSEVSEHERPGDPS